ncbi:haloacid dehalogenase [Trichodelitschia bisporula]|uniref:Haloacid dehalogenase n=1 Tax=Trichodelitschia bisporula TaxID=703511 RepID=A0A6G1I2K5_9PEZI|nr:haloacid dehalogenase [Trichodelitschia bisporula]
MSFTDPPARALLFDVFGTCVDWRSTVTNGLADACHVALNSPTSSIPSAVRLRATGLTSEDWGKLAQEWRNTYKQFTKALASDSSIPWKSVDHHHLDALGELLTAWQLEGLWTPEEVHDLSLIWHRLNPWPDSSAGIAALCTKFQTCTLSNGNLSLLQDLKKHANLDFTHVFSAELFNSYKPSPAVYLGAAEKLGCAPAECVMVAAHLADLKAAKACGFRTVYVERPLEEDWDAHGVRDAHLQGFVDVWVSVDEDGFVAVARKLGIDVNAG